MYLDIVSKDEINYAHIVSNLRSPHNIIVSTKDYILFFMFQRQIIIMLNVMINQEKKMKL